MKALLNRGGVECHGLLKSETSFECQGLLNSNTFEEGLSAKGFSIEKRVLSATGFSIATRLNDLKTVIVMMKRNEDLEERKSRGSGRCRGRGRSR